MTFIAVDAQNKRKAGANEIVDINYGHLSGRKEHQLFRKSFPS
jgi:hypothetical protein